MARRRLHHIATQETGLSLVELLIAMVMTAIIGSTLLSIVTSSLRTGLFASDTRATMDETRVAVERVARELRGARRVYPTSTGTSLRFWTDADVDGLQDTNEQVTYSLVANAGRTELQRSTEVSGSTSRVVARNLSSATAFTYDVAPPDTQVVTVTFTATSIGSGGASNLTATAGVRLRNVN